MRYGKHGLCLLVTAAIGMTAFAATAQAVTPQFLIGGKSVGALIANLGGVQIGGTGGLLVPALNLRINCTKFSVQEGVINSGTHANGKLLFEECAAFTIAPEEEIAECQIISSETDSRPHITSTGLILPAELENGSPGLLVEKIVSKVLFTGEECFLPESNVAKGELCVKIDDNDTVEPTILMNQTIQGECSERSALEGGSGKGFKDKMLYGSQETFVDRTASLFLTGVHKGMTLGVSLF